MLPRLAGALAIVAALVAAAPAAAATVSVKDTRVTSTSDLAFRAARGEANRVRFELRAKRVTVTDAGAPVAAGRGCRTLSAHRAVCRTTLDEFYFYKVRLGDRDDRVTFHQRAHGQLGIPEVTAGAGDDSVRAGGLRRSAFVSGGDGDDRITGTRDADALRGGAGRDVLAGLKGDDQFVPDPPGARHYDDTVLGGPGDDQVSYSGATKPVSIDLRRSSPQGSAGEHDAFCGVEGAVGTAGDDQLRGNDADNDLQGIGGRDVIEGFGGDDRVWGGGGKKRDREPDTISGGPGADTVLAPGGGNASGDAGDDQLEGSGTLDAGPGDDSVEPTGGRVECGDGDDGVSITTVAPPLLVACESLVIGRDNELSMGLPLVRGENDIVANGLHCDPEDGPTRDSSLCTGELRVSLGDQLLGKGSFNANDRTVSAHLPYEQGAREALAGGPKEVRTTIGRYSFVSSLRAAAADAPPSGASNHARSSRLRGYPVAAQVGAGRRIYGELPAGTDLRDSRR